MVDRSASGHFASGDGRRGGFTLRQRVEGGTWYTRFTVGGDEIELSTGSRDADAARSEAERLYGEQLALASNRPRKVKPIRTRRGLSVALEDLIAEWLSSLVNTHAAGTLKGWELYAGTHFIPFFVAVHNVNAGTCADYMRSRLGQVRSQTVRKELTALRSLLAWGAESGFLPPFEVPKLPKRSAGTPFERRSRVSAVPLSRDQVEAFLAALPEWSSSRKVERFAVRARFVVAYETSLRPSTLDRLSVPEHYRKGETSLRLSEASDKNRWSRDVPLTERARAALDAVLADLGDGYEGFIFGDHDHRTHVQRTANKVFPRELAERFCPAHLRSARITHLLEQSGNLPGVQHMAGHRQTTTTSRYVRPSFRAALDVLEAEANA